MGGFCLKHVVLLAYYHKSVMGKLLQRFGQQHTLSHIESCFFSHSYRHMPETLKASLCLRGEDQFS